MVLDVFVDSKNQYSSSHAIDPVSGVGVYKLFSRSLLLSFHHNNHLLLPILVRLQTMVAPAVVFPKHPISSLYGSWAIPRLQKRAHARAMDRFRSYLLCPTYCELNSQNNSYRILCLELSKDSLRRLHALEISASFSKKLLIYLLCRAIISVGDVYKYAFFFLSLLFISPLCFYQKCVQ
jgi:hypothetical protein